MWPATCGFRASRRTYPAFGAGRRGATKHCHFRGSVQTRQTILTNRPATEPSCIYSLLMNRAGEGRRFLAVAVGVATVVLCSAFSSLPAQASSVCQLLLSQKEASTILDIGRMHREGGGVNCAYVSERELGIVLSLIPSRSSKAVPYMNQSGSQLVSVDGVQASWRLSSSPTRTSNLAFRSGEAIVQIGINPAVASAKAKAEKTMSYVLQHGGRNVRVSL